MCKLITAEISNIRAIEVFQFVRAAKVTTICIAKELKNQ